MFCVKKLDDVYSKYVERSKVASLGWELVFGHNDLNSGNIIESDRGTKLNTKINRIKKSNRKMNKKMKYVRTRCMVVLTCRCGAGVMSFIDYEYAGPSERAFDIANHFCECCGMSSSFMNLRISQMAFMNLRI